MEILQLNNYKYTLEKIALSANLLMQAQGVAKKKAFSAFVQNKMDLFSKRTNQQKLFHQGVVSQLRSNIKK